MIRSHASFLGALDALRQWSGEVAKYGVGDRCREVLFRMNAFEQTYRAIPLLEQKQPATEETKSFVKLLLWASGEIKCEVDSLQGDWEVSLLLEGLALIAQPFATMAVGLCEDTIKKGDADSMANFQKGIALLADIAHDIACLGMCDSIVSQALDINWQENFDIQSTVV